MFPKLGGTLGPIVNWTMELALPYWGSVGVDQTRGGFHERLDLKGQPVLDVPKRLMVQGRQLYVYCHASHLGWCEDGRRLADRCVDYILHSYYRADGGPGWLHSLAPDGSIANSMRDTYAHAFVLLGLAWYHRVTGDAQVLSVVNETLAYLDEFSASSRGGYLDAVPPPDAIRRQNPHMHLFEAFLALHQATSDAKYLARAAEVFGVFTTSFFQPATRSLCEYLTDDLHPIDPPAGTAVEPGHHYEWIWLLRCFEKVSGRSVGSFCSALYDHADRYGWDAQNYILDEVDAIGYPIKSSRRSWPHTEGLKANIVEGEVGRPGCDERAARCLARLSDTFLGRPFPAGWIDRVDENGRSLVEFVPASTLYHIFCAVTEAERATRLPSN